MRVYGKTGRINVMLKVFLVEDEVVVREGIKNHIDWQQEGFIYVGEASDGELAYPMIQKTRPDIIITDIKMPFMDGLSLSRLIKAEFPAVKILILSGYDEFEYAKEAINIGIAEYLVKPIKADMLLQAVKRAAVKIREERAQSEFMETFRREMHENEHLERQYFFNELISSKKTALELLEKGRKMNIDLAACMYNIILYKVTMADEREQEYSEDLIHVGEKVESLAADKQEIIMFDRSTEGWAFLIKETAERSVAQIQDYYLHEFQKIMSEYPAVKYFGGVGMQVNRLRNLPMSFHEASRAFAYRYILPENQVMSYDALKDYKLMREGDVTINSLAINKLDRKVLENFLKSGSHNEIDQFIEEYFYNIGEKQLESMLIRQYVVMDMYFSCVNFVESLGQSSEKITSISGDFQKVASNLSTLDNTKLYFRSLFEEVLNNRDIVSMKRNSILIEKAKQYIEDNYNKEDISLNTAAADVNLSPSHFSMIFSQEAGQTFIEYLTGTRMEKAKELLRCSGLKISEIAYAIGYKDPHYFSYLFKKIQNCTPKEFKAQGSNRVS